MLLEVSPVLPLLLRIELFSLQCLVNEEGGSSGGGSGGGSAGQCVLVESA